MSQLGPFLAENWRLLLPARLGMAAVYLLLPRARRYPPLWGGVAAGLALAAAAWLLIRTETALPETVLFYAFSGLAVARTSPPRSEAATARSARRPDHRRPPQAGGGRQARARLRDLGAER